MKKIAFFTLILCSFIVDGAFGATAARRARTAPAATGASQSATGGAGRTTSARAAVARTAPRTGAPAATAANGNTGGRTTSARAATNSTASAPKAVSARAGTTQKVINSGTKVAAAAKNTVVNEECLAKYEGCMDAFCMVDNENGGRCTCSDRGAELDVVLAEIEKLDEQSYQMATLGVEKLEMGADADAAIAAANQVADSLKKPEAESKKRKALNLDMWNVAEEDAEEDIFAESGSQMSSIDGKTGDALHRAASELCVAQIPECATNLDMLKLMYSQKVKSDCAAYENSLKQKKTQSSQKLQAAERALRETALEQYQAANKYDLGQCTIKFKECMQTTADCGSDFSKCASVVATDTTNVKYAKQKAKVFKIKGAVTEIEISASTYDTLIAKKPLCETVTKQCVKVADQVWDTFLKDAAPQLKSAELIAENNARQNCIGSISDCFQKACKDNIDPKDPDGSYDMCLSRPAAMLNVCKIPLNACGIDTSSAAKAEKSQIWGFVTARLASMRVDECTNQVKKCLSDENRCGKDYTQCIGLGVDEIRAMCPNEVLTSCQKDGNAVDNIEDIIRGIYLAIDNSLLDSCLKAVDKKMLEICDDTNNCAAFLDDKNMGTESLFSYTDANGDTVIEGLLSFANVKITENDKVTAPADSNNVKLGRYTVAIDDYTDNMEATSAAQQRIIASLQGVANKINQKIAILSQDPTIKMCVEGRSTTSYRSSADTAANGTSNARFPYLLDAYIMSIISAGIDQANLNYNAKYNELLGKALESKDDAVKATLCAAMATDTKPKCDEYETAKVGKLFSLPVCKKFSTGNFEDVFADSKASGYTSEGKYNTKIVIAGAKLQNLASVQQKGHSEYVQTDKDGNMLGKLMMSATYSSATNTCTLVTTSTMCKNQEAVITTDTIDSCTQTTFSLVGGGGCGGGGGIFSTTTSTHEHRIEQNFEGAVCTEFGEPQTTETDIKM